jgi:hypothetical protein
MRELYESDTTKFLRELLQKSPQIVEDQKKARARWWDKKLDLDELKRQDSAQAPRAGYYYYDNPKPAEKPKSST